jgi:outer membrane protein assembly factor BamB
MGAVGRKRIQVDGSSRSRSVAWTGLGGFDRRRWKPPRAARRGTGRRGWQGLHHRHASDGARVRCPVRRDGLVDAVRDGKEQQVIAVRRRRRVRQRPNLCDERSRLCRGARRPQWRIIWQVHPAGPLRGSPTVVGDTVYAITQDNQIYSLKTSDGSTNWSQAAALEIAGFFGTASPAVGQGTVVAGFSSGELNAYRYENGRLVWQDQLARTSIRTSVASISDVDADPVIDNGQVLAVGQGGRMVSIELLSGQRQWELNIAGISTPWVIGDWAYVVTDDGKLLCVARANGKIRWIAQLPAFRHEKKKAGPISYSGPVLAGNRLIVVNSEGALINVDPATGAVQSQTSIKAPISLSPVVANQTLYILDDDGRLHAFR